MFKMESSDYPSDYILFITKNHILTTDFTVIVHCVALNLGLTPLGKKCYQITSYLVTIFT